MIKSTLPIKANSHNDILEILKANNAVFETIEHEAVTTIFDVLRVLNLEVSKTAKTIVLEIKESDKIIAVIVGGDKAINYTKLLKILDLESVDSIKLMRRSELLKLGLEVGGISPLSGIFDVILFDIELAQFNYIFCGCGEKTATLKINPLILADIIGAKVINIGAKQKKETMI